VTPAAIWGWAIYPAARQLAVFPSGCFGWTGGRGCQIRRVCRGRVFWFFLESASGGRACNMEEDLPSRVLVRWFVEEYMGEVLITDCLAGEGSGSVVAI